LIEVQGSVQDSDLAAEIARQRPSTTGINEAESGEVLSDWQNFRRLDFRIAHKKGLQPTMTVDEGRL
jgi:hypothetical protein